MSEELNKYQVIIDTAIVSIPVFEGSLSQCQKEYKKWCTKVKKNKWINVDDEKATLQCSHVISVRTYKLPIESVVANNMLKNPYNSQFAENAQQFQNSVLDGGYK